MKSKRYVAVVRRYPPESGDIDHALQRMADEHAGIVARAASPQRLGRMNVTTLFCLCQHCLKKTGEAVAGHVDDPLGLNKIRSNIKLLC
ncbi:hypothetical protein [Thiobacillus denitrificans]|uniref:hypothetical protein n=1 Tax=Thiobacillus denitrificans TaxID=36861 RepID=UPI00192D1BE8|nr:hypothetical protein [Thiobacillus denitrificans]